MTTNAKNASDFSRLIWLALTIFILFVSVFVIYIHAEKQINYAYEVRQKSFFLADELRQSSDDLTRMVRSYVVTGDPRYKEHYLEILAIRDGNKPRPMDYQNIYWDLVLADNQRPRPFEPAISMLNLMLKVGFTEAEFAEIEAAKGNSDALTKAEFTAMSLFESQIPENRQRAIDLLFDQSYHEAKAGIMRPIDVLYQMMDKRTQEAVHVAARTALLIRILLIIFGFLTAITLWLAYRTLFTTLGCSVGELHKYIVRLGSGDFLSTIPVLEKKEKSVLGWLAETQANLANLDAERTNQELLLKASEQNLRKAKEDFENVLRSATEISIISTDKNGLITVFNRGAELMLGYSADEMVGKQTPCIIHDWQEIAQRGQELTLQSTRTVTDFQAIVENANIHGYETREWTYIRKDKSRMTVSLTVTTIRNEHDEIVGYVGIAEDITKRKQAEKKLRDSELKLRTIYNSTSDAFMLLDEHGFIDCNKAALNMFGCTSVAAFCSQHPADVSPPVQPCGTSSITLANEKITHAIEQGDCRFEWIHKRIDTGECFPAEVLLCPMKLGDKSIIQGIVRDITERKTMEMELRRSNAELEQFAYAVSHDMRQPLRMVTSYLGLIEKALQAQLDDDTRQFLNFALDGAKRMDSMILSLLDYSRFSKKHKALTVISSREAIDEALLFLRPALETSGGKVEVLGNWIDLIANRDELTRLLQNLIGNALKYHEADKPPVVKVCATVTANIFRVEVHDSGIGINPSQIERLFKVFSRLQARSHFEGTGVGLALCRKIVEHHGGTLGVISEGEGLGSVFWFELPRKPIEG